MLPVYNPPKLAFLSLSHLRLTRLNKTQLSGLWDLNLSYFNTLLVIYTVLLAAKVFLSTNRVASEKLHHVA